MISGEQVNFTYDALNRLATAQTSANSNVTQWGQSFTYDGFGNLTNVNVTQGSAPTYPANYNASTNQQTGDCADANGNIGTSGPQFPYGPYMINAMPVNPITGIGCCARATSGHAAKPAIPLMISRRRIAFSKA